MTSSRLAGKIAIVTGAGRGIGRAIAHALASEGAVVALTARTQAEIEREAEAIRTEGGKAASFAGDVTDQRQVESMVAGVLKQYGTIDILVNNAGVGVFRPVSELSVAEFDTMWNVNMRGVFLVTKAVLPAMRKAQTGTIVNIASLAGKNAVKGGAGYSATKWALRGFGASLMLEVRDDNIRVVTICPGSVDTGFYAGGKKGPAITQPSDVAETVLFAVTAPARTMVSEIDIRPTRPS